VGVLGYLLLACDTLADALQGFERYQRLLHDGDRASAQLQDGLLCLRWSNEYGPSSRLSDEVLVVGMLSFIRRMTGDRKSTRLNSSHVKISYAVFCLKKKKTTT